MRILIVEDDERIGLALKEELEHQQYLVDLAFDGEIGQKLAQKRVHDLVIIDLALPKVSGLQICHDLRQAGFDGGILILSAKASRYDKIAGLDTGADDYLTKPFDIEELLARIRALVRRIPKEDSMLTHNGIRLDPQRCSVFYNDTPIILTPTEFRLLAHFLRNPKSTFSRQLLIERLWLVDTPDDGAIKTYIKSLRKKFQSAGAPKDIIETVYGFGYRLK